VYLRPTDTEHTMQPPPLRLPLLRGVYPCMFDVRAVSKRVASIGSIGRSVDAGVAQVKGTLEMVAVRIPHLAIAYWPCQFLQDGVSPLPVTFINKVCADKPHAVTVAAVNPHPHFVLGALYLHLLAHLDGESFATHLQRELQSVVGGHDEGATLILRHGFTHLDLFLVNLIVLLRYTGHHSTTVDMTVINVDVTCCSHVVKIKVKNEFSQDPISVRETARK